MLACSLFALCFLVLHSPCLPGVINTWLWLVHGNAKHWTMNMDIAGSASCRVAQ
jgi:hypothetical protein